jgi:hypothetical protein
MSDNTSYFITVDAETDVIVEGVRTNCAVRDRIERDQGCRIPILWFVRFQRSWNDSVAHDKREFFLYELGDEYDGYRLPDTILGPLSARGDEIGWHYHAYHYVHRDDLAHDEKIDNIEADLITCANTIRARYPQIPLRSFRWGWWFIPDYRLCATLSDLGFDIDASIDPRLTGTHVAEFNAVYPEPITSEPVCLKGTHFFLYVNTYLTHDYEVIPHDFGWSRKDAHSAETTRNALENDMRTLVRRAQVGNIHLSTYASIVG